jgi:hypothetical protein
VLLKSCLFAPRSPCGNCGQISPSAKRTKRTCYISRLTTHLPIFPMMSSWSRLRDEATSTSCRGVLNESALVSGRHIFGGHFPLRIALLRDARARSGKLSLYEDRPPFLSLGGMDRRSASGSMRRNITPLAAWAGKRPTSTSRSARTAARAARSVFCSSKCTSIARLGICLNRSLQRSYRSILRHKMRPRGPRSDEQGLAERVGVTGRKRQ